MAELNEDKVQRGIMFCFPREEDIFLYIDKMVQVKFISNKRNRLIYAKRNATMNWMNSNAKIFAIY